MDADTEVEAEGLPESVSVRVPLAEAVVELHTLTEAEGHPERLGVVLEHRDAVSLDAGVGVKGSDAIVANGVADSEGLTVAEADAQRVGESVPDELSVGEPLPERLDVLEEQRLGEGEPVAHRVDERLPEALRVADCDWDAH